MNFFNVKDKDGNWISPKSDPLIDQEYSSTSENAQSGIAVAEAVAPKQDKIGDVTRQDELRVALTLQDILNIYGDKAINVYNPIFISTLYKNGYQVLNSNEVQALLNQEDQNKQDKIFDVMYEDDLQISLECKKSINIYQSDGDGTVYMHKPTDFDELQKNHISVPNNNEVQAMIAAQVGNIETALTNIEAIQDALIGGNT